MSAEYPQIDDWTQARLGDATTILARGPGAALALGLTDSGDVVEQSFRDLALQLADVSVARLPVLSRRAALYGVTVDGLDVSEARMIVAGASVARVASGSTADVCAVWSIATGALPGTSRVYFFPRGLLGVWSTVASPPTARYLVALRGLMERVVPAGYGLHGWLGTPSVGRYDDARYDAARYGWSVAVTRPGG